VKKKEDLLQVYYLDVYRYLRALTLNESLAEELTQETFYKALKSLGTFRGESEVRVWLCAIAKNLYRDRLRRKGREEPMPEEEPASDSKPLAEMLADKDEAARLHRILHGLREPYKEIFTLRVFGELSFADIAALFGKNDHWACVTYHRAKAMIREQWDKEEES